jgi:hypothetical protein
VSAIPDPPTLWRWATPAARLVVLALALVAAAHPARADWHDWTAVAFETGPERTARETFSVAVPKRFPDGARVCALYENVGDARKGRVSLAVEVVSAASGTVAETIDMGSRNLKRASVGGFARFFCTPTTPLAKGDVLLYHFELVGLPAKKRSHKVGLQLEPPFSKRDSIEFVGIEPGFGATLRRGNSVDLTVDYECNQVARCWILAGLTRELDREMPNLAARGVHTVAAGSGTVTIPMQLCDDASFGEGLRLAIVPYATTEKLGELWIPGTYNCD